MVELGDAPVDAVGIESKAMQPIVLPRNPADLDHVIAAEAITEAAIEAEEDVNQREVVQCLLRKVANPRARLVIKRNGIIGIVNVINGRSSNIHLINVQQYQPHTPTSIHIPPSNPRNTRI